MKKKTVFFSLVISFFVSLTLVYVLFLFDFFSAETKNIEQQMKQELSILTKKLKANFSIISIETTSLSQNLAKKFAEDFNDNKRISENLTNNQIENQELNLTKLINDKHNLNLGILNSNHNLTKLINESYTTLHSGLITSHASGVFFISDFSFSKDALPTNKAGLYLRNLEPNVINSNFYDIRYFIGPASIQREKKISMVPQWQMEFVLKPEVINIFTALQNIEGQITTNKQFNWSKKTTLEDYTRVVICSSPVKDNNGRFWGIAGYDISEMLFKLQYSPSLENKKSFFILTSFESATSNLNEQVEPSISFNIDDSLVSSNFINSKIAPTGTVAVFEKNNSTIFVDSLGKRYIGFFEHINLYQTDSPFENKINQTAIFIPEDEILILKKKEKINTFAFFCISFLIFGIIPVFFSAFFIKEKILVKEIVIPQNTKETEIFENFIANLNTLSISEKRIFDLYRKNYSGAEIAKKLNLSINTVKTHSKHIYEKLGISSRKELLVFTSMMDEMKNKH